MSEVLQAPFPWFGGKSRVAPLVWERFGGVRNYVEPFFGSGATLLGRPDPITGLETVNDLDGLVCNFWRAIQAKPDETAEWADNPVVENDLHARHVWLVQRMGDLPDRLEGDPYWCDPQIAGWWAWGLSCWIGSGFCSRRGAWWPDDEGRLVRSGSGRGVNRQLVHLGDAGRGVKRQRVHLGEWFQALSTRLRDVRVACGDWSRVCGPAVTFSRGLTGVFLDPPYADTANRDSAIYRVDSDSVAHAARDWAVAQGDNPLMRIALCGYKGEHVMPDSWDCVPWKAQGGYAGQAKDRENVNARRERIWFSPHCLRPTTTSKQRELFKEHPDDTTA